MEFKSDFLNIIEKRGYLNQTTHPKELDELMTKKKIAVYIGFDLTAKSLHIGSLIQIMVLRHLQKCGHKPIILLGGGTTKIGDPSGKDEARQLLNEQNIEENLSGIKKILEKFDLSKTDKNLPAFEFVNNDDWLKNLKYIEFLRDFGRHFSVNRMLGFDSVKLRLERQQPLSFLEFNYMILQAYDFYHLNQNYDCYLQIGGSDQWGNIVNGVELTRRIAHINDNKGEVYGLTTPLLTTSDGKKMGKTANGAIWLCEDLFSPFDYYQYFRNIDDSDVEKMLKFFTDLSLDEIENLKSQNINQNKALLAFEATKICHGIDKANEVNAKINAIFSAKNSEFFDKKEFLLSEGEITNGKKLAEIIFEINAAPSKGEAKRLIKGGAVKINNQAISDENFAIKEFGEFELNIGKKKFFKILLNNK